MNTCKEMFKFPDQDCYPSDTELNHLKIIIDEGSWKLKMMTERSPIMLFISKLFLLKYFTCAEAYNCDSYQLLSLSNLINLLAYKEILLE